jgi:hypothetical protein
VPTLLSARQNAVGLANNAKNGKMEKSSISGSAGAGMFGTWPSRGTMEDVVQSTSRSLDRSRHSINAQTARTLHISLPVGVAKHLQKGDPDKTSANDCTIGMTRCALTFHRGFKGLLCFFVQLNLRSSIN